jgi:AraC family transcriptional activator of pobA
MSRRIPTYALYGEQAGQIPEFWGHAETIASRSSINDWEIKPHRHDALFQILHLRSGEAQALIAGRWLDVPLPSAIIVPEGHEHGFRFSHDIDGAVMTVMSKRLPASLPAHGGFAEWLGRPRVVALDPQGPDSTYIRQTLDRIEAELSHTVGVQAPLVENLLAAALLLIFRVSGPPVEIGGEGRDRVRLEQLMRLIDLNSRSHHPVEFYARRLGMSATHLNRLTRMLTGRPVTRLLADRLVSEAKRELVFTSHAVQQIANRLGFEDAAYFSRFFAQNAGLSPRAYREQERARMKPQDA